MIFLFIITRSAGRESKTKKSGKRDCRNNEILFVAFKKRVKDHKD